MGIWQPTCCQLAREAEDSDILFSLCFAYQQPRAPTLHGLLLLRVHMSRERLLSSVSLYAIARHAYQEAEYDEAIIALEESLALRLFAYADQKTLDRWQQGLVMPGSLFRRQKMDLANTLVLRSDCLVQLARVSSGSGGRGSAAALKTAALFSLLARTPLQVVESQQVQQL